MVGFNIFFAEHQTYTGYLVRDANGYGIVMMVLGLTGAAFWAALSADYENDLAKRIQGYRESQLHLYDRVTAIESRPEPRQDEDLKKHLIALEMRITELDSRVSGNDPFGG